MIAHSEQIERSARLYVETAPDTLPLTRSRGGQVPTRKRGLSTELALDMPAVEAALNLVYRAYLSTGLIETHSSEMRVTPYHLLPTTNVFLARENDEVVGTLTLVRDGLLRLPMEAEFSEEIEARRQRGIRMAEVSCLADAGQGKHPMLNVVVQLMSHMAQFALRNGVTELVIAVHPHHVGFYERFAGFEVIGEQRTYAAVCDHPAVALAVNLETIHVKNPRVHERFFGKPFPDRQLTPQRLDPKDLAVLQRIVEFTYPDYCLTAAYPEMMAAAAA